MERSMSEAKFDDAVKHAGETINSAGKSAGAAAERAADEAIPMFTDAARMAGDAVRSAGKRASALFTDLSEGVPEAREQVVTRVQAQPLTAVLLAAGVGMLAGMLLLRR